MPSYFQRHHQFLFKGDEAEPYQNFWAAPCAFLNTQQAFFSRQIQFNVIVPHSNYGQIPEVSLVSILAEYVGQSGILRDDYITATFQTSPRRCAARLFTTFSDFLFGRLSFRAFCWTHKRCGFFLSKAACLVSRLLVPAGATGYIGL